MGGVRGRVWEMGGVRCSLLVSFWSGVSVAQVEVPKESEEEEEDEEVQFEVVCICVWM